MTQPPCDTTAGDRQIFLIEITPHDGWLVAYLVLEGQRTELCRMVKPPPQASLRHELIKCFEKLASTLIESVLRDDMPDATVTTKSASQPGNA